MRKLTTLIIFVSLNSFSCEERVLDILYQDKKTYADFEFVTKIELEFINTVPSLEKLESIPFRAKVLTNGFCRSKCKVKYLSDLDIIIPYSRIIGFKDSPSKKVPDSQCAELI